MSKEEQQALTHSRMACFRACPKRHWIRYELGITPEEEAFHLRVGSGFHAAMEALDKDEDVDAAIGAWIKDDYDYAMIAAMVDGYRDRWTEEPLDVVATEMEFDIPLRNPDTGRMTPTFRLRGKIDKLAKTESGQIAVVEHKTTSHDFSPDADYWQKLKLDLQPSIYVIAARELGYDVSTILYDVTRRPGLRMLKATPEEKRKFTKKGTLYKNQRAADETPDEYLHRVAAWIAENRDDCFRRQEIARLDQDLEECQAEIWQQQLAIRSAQLSGHWYRNPGACYAPFKCSYLPICQNRDLEERTPMGFVRSDVIHPELSSDTSLDG